jgi:hypothetical protein
LGYEKRIRLEEVYGSMDFCERGQSVFVSPGGFTLLARCKEPDFQRLEFRDQEG